MGTVPAPTHLKVQYVYAVYSLSLPFTTEPPGKPEGPVNSVNALSHTYKSKISPVISDIKKRIQCNDSILP